MAEADEELRPDAFVDDAGNLWTCRWARWATPRDIRRMLNRGQQVAVRRLGEGVTRLSPDEARELWPRIRKHIEVPGTDYGPDDDGFTYAAHVWRSGSDRLLCIEVFC